MAEYTVMRGCCECQDVGSQAFKVCLPENFDCVGTCTDYYLKRCGDLWCSKMCNLDKPYANPLIEGDTISFQLTEIDTYNTDASMPTSGWGDFVTAEICDKDGSTVLNNVDDFSTNYVVGWTGDRSYQTLVIDTDSISLDCFSVKITSYSAPGFVKNEYCSEPFEKLPIICEDDTLLIESSYSCDDCCGMYYGTAPEADNFTGTSNFQFSNKFRIPAKLEQTSVSIEKNEFGGKFTSSTTACVFALRMQKKVPPYVANQIYKQHFSAPVTFINGQAFRIPDATLSNKLSTSRMFLFDQEMTEECSVKFNCKC